MKRFLSLIMVLIILIFSCVPVFGSTVDENYFDFTNFSLYDSTATYFSSDIYTYINDNISLDIYVFPYLYYYRSTNKYKNAFVFFAVPKDTTISFSDNSTPSEVSGFSDYTSSSIYTSTSFTGKGDYYAVNFRMAFDISISSSYEYYINHKIYDSSNFLLFRDGKCVSEAFCSSDYFYVDDDYQEGNITIEGLGGFFDNILNSMKETLNTVKETPSLIITGLINGLKELFIPDVENMKESFQYFIDYMTSKFGFNELIETLQGLIDSAVEDNSSVGAADIDERAVYTFHNRNIYLDFSVPFSDFFNSIAKNRIGGYLKGIFFILLIFYNLSELYFIIRGVRPWKDPQISLIHNEIERNDINSYIANRKGGGWGV